jgi:hypothetical protein
MRRTFALALAPGVGATAPSFDRQRLKAAAAAVDVDPMLGKRATARAAAEERVDVASRVDPFIRSIFSGAVTPSPEPRRDSQS